MTLKSVETALLQCEVNGIYTNTVFGNSLPQPVPPQPVPPPVDPPQVVPVPSPVDPSQVVLVPSPVDPSQVVPPQPVLLQPVPPQPVLLQPVPPQPILVQSAPPPTPVNPLQVVPIPLVDSSQPVPVQPILVQPVSPQHVPYPVDPVPPYPDPNVPVIMDNSSNQPNVDLAQLTPIRPIISPSFEIQEAQNLVCLNVDPENDDPAPAPAPFLIPVEPMEKNGNHTSSSMSHNSIPHSVLPIPLNEPGIVSNTIPMEPTPVPTISMPPFVSPAMPDPQLVQLPEVVEPNPQMYYSNNSSINEFEERHHESLPEVQSILLL